MSRPFFTRCAAWLRLALVLLTGLTPARGFVLCIEADGCVRVELRSSADDCGGCDGHAEAAKPADAAAFESESEACPCVDVAVLGVSNGQFARQGDAGNLGASVWNSPPKLQGVVWREPAHREHPPAAAAPPRSADSLQHLRSVILRV